MAARDPDALPDFVGHRMPVFGPGSPAAAARDEVVIAAMDYECCVRASACNHATENDLRHTHAGLMRAVRRLLEEIARDESRGTSAATAAASELKMGGRARTGGRARRTG